MSSSKKAALAIGYAVLWIGAVFPVRAQAPFYYSSPLTQKQDPQDFAGLDGSINLKRVPPSTSAAEAEGRFPARAAAALFYSANHLELLVSPEDRTPGHPCHAVPKGTIGGLCNEGNFGTPLLAKMAYGDYFNDPERGKTLREDVYELLRNERPGTIGTSVDDDQKHFGVGPNIRHAEYDVLLQSYLALYYKYYNVILAEAPDVLNILLRRLLTVNGPYPVKNSERYLSFHFDEPVGVFPFLIQVRVDVPETENHFLMIESARYLTNQLLYESGDGSGPTHQPQFDNNRNGGPGKSPLVDVILQKLQKILKSDFTEYNARPYQDYNMPPLLNLASYAYDDRVRLAARMVLDYVSAKVAVSSNDLRRSTPYRRRNEPGEFGIVIPPGPDGHLVATVGIGAKDTQTAFYAQLAGNTELLGSPEGGYSSEMVNAGLRDYRVPSSILDLFINHRRLYQRFHHSAPTDGANTGEFADELYANSPGYLITGGGHPTSHSAVVNVFVDDLLVRSEGIDPDRGVAVPTTLMPAAAADWITRFNLDTMIQFGSFGNNVAANNNMCVAPDFACGDFTYVPPGYTAPSEYIPTFIGDVVIARPPHWIFIDHGKDLNVLHPPATGGYYLALYDFADAGSHKGFVEAYDVALHPGVTFHDFVFGGHGITGVFTKYGSNPTFGIPLLEATIYAYQTQSGQQIAFSISGSKSDILTTSEVPVSDDWKNKFAYGTILNSELGSAVINITNPEVRGSKITLDMRDQNRDGDPLYGIHHPCRLSELDGNRCAGGNEEVWLDFHSPANVPEVGDVYRPFKTLSNAVKGVAVGGTINIIPGSRKEPILIKTPMTLKSFPGSATIGRQ